MNFSNKLIEKGASEKNIVLYFIPLVLLAAHRAVDTHTRGPKLTLRRAFTTSRDPREANTFVKVSTF